MKALSKVAVFFSLCIFAFCFFALSHPGEAWSAPKGKIVLGQTGDATTLDPHMTYAMGTLAIIRNIYDHLINRYFDRDNQLQHYPMLATSWETIDDKTWIFHGSQVVVNPFFARFDFPPCIRFLQTS